MRRFNIGIIWAIVALLDLFLGMSSCTKQEATSEVPLIVGPEQPFKSPILSSINQSPLPSGGEATPIASLPPLKLEPGRGGVKGEVSRQPSDWKGKQLYAWFCPFYPGERPGEGVYVLEPSIQANSLVTRDGKFQHGAIEPGQYVIVVGSEPRDAQPIGERGRPKIVEITAGEVLELGKMSVGQ